MRGPARRALVVGDRVLGPAAAAWEAACLRLARAAGCALLELTFARRADGRDCVAAATSLPTLRRAEEVEAVAALLAAAAA